MSIFTKEILSDKSKEPEQSPAPARYFLDGHRLSSLYRANTLTEKFPWGNTPESARGWPLAWREAPYIAPVVSDFVTSR